MGLAVKMRGQLSFHELSFSRYGYFNHSHSENFAVVGRLGVLNEAGVGPRPASMGRGAPSGPPRGPGS